MATEVTLRIYDPHGRASEWWEAMLEALVNIHDAEIIEADDEEV